MTNENTQSIWLGDVEVIRVREWQGFFTSAHELVPDSARVWEDNGHWLAPDHWEPEQGQAVMALQSWVLRSAGQTILIDTGVGNGRERPHSPHFHHWQTDFLGALAGVGVHPEDVDIVVNTHLHADHVGWNTHDVGGEWAPTFPTPATSSRGGRLPLRARQLPWKGTEPGRRPGLRGQHRAGPPGRTGPAVGRHPPHRRTPHPGAGPRPHPRLIRPAPGIPR